MQALERNKGVLKENLDKYCSHTTLIEGYDCLEDPSNFNDEEYGDEENDDEYDPEHDEKRESPEQARARVERVANREKDIILPQKTEIIQ